MKTIKEQLEGGVWTLTQPIMDAIKEEAYDRGYRDAVREMNAKRLEELKETVRDLLEDLEDGEGEQE